MYTLYQHFLGPIIFSSLVFAAMAYYAGSAALFMVAIISILEITLSFDNAVVNAKVLEQMSPVWQKRFLTWGIAIAVFGTRFLLPIFIVSIAVWNSPWFITKLAFHDAAAYGHLLEGVHGSITAFGGMFLLMVSLKYFFDEAKEVHWIETIEKHLARGGSIEAIEVLLALCLLALISFFSPYEQGGILIAGIVGLVLFIAMEGIAGSVSATTNAVAQGGLALFIYLNVLDSAFSLDGVVGAFALSNNIVTIVAGLGIGAYFVRSLTVYFVHQKTLTHLMYLEQGAHWAIFGLAVAMLADLIVPIPEIFTALVGFFCIATATISSRRTGRN